MINRHCRRVLIRMTCVLLYYIVMTEQLYLNSELSSVIYLIFSVFVRTRK